MQDALANAGGSSPSLGATIYASRFAANALRALRETVLVKQEWQRGYHLFCFRSQQNQILLLKNNRQVCFIYLFLLWVTLRLLTLCKRLRLEQIRKFHPPRNRKTYHSRKQPFIEFVVCILNLIISIFASFLYFYIFLCNFVYGCIYKKKNFDVFVYSYYIYIFLYYILIIFRICVVSSIIKYM